MASSSGWPRRDRSVLWSQRKKGEFLLPGLEVNQNNHLHPTVLGHGHAGLPLWFTWRLWGCNKRTRSFKRLQAVEPVESGSASLPCGNAPVFDDFTNMIAAEAGEFLTQYCTIVVLRESCEAQASSSFSRSIRWWCDDRCWSDHSFSESCSDFRISSQHDCHSTIANAIVIAEHFVGRYHIYGRVYRWGIFAFKRYYRPKTRLVDGTMLKSS